MRARAIFAFLFLLTLGVGAAGWGWGWRERRQLVQADFTRRRLDFVDAENRRLSALLDAKQRAEDIAASLAKRTEIEQAVTGLRSLPFLRPVKYREIPRSQLPEILRQKLFQQVPDQEFGDTSVALAALGLLPHGLDLKKTYLALLGEQIGAFYDQHSQELVTFSGQSLSNSQNRVILAHELTHALEDQHFNLSRLPLEAKGNDDRSLAASALVEGDATLVMNRYLAGNLSAAVLKDSLASALTTDVRQLASAPRYLRETLLFPYLHGLEFCQTLYDQGGWEALANAFEHPPSSTSEILHPERFLMRARQSSNITALSGTTVLGQKPVDDNVLGEFGIRQLFSAWLKDDQTASQAADGWRDDHFLVYGDTAASSYLWQTSWEDAPAARRYAAAMKRYLSVRYAGMVPTKTGSPAGNYLLSSSTLSWEGRTVLLANLSATEIVLVDAQDARWFSALQVLCRASGTHP